MDENGVTLPLPKGGLQHRILDILSASPVTTAEGRSFLHRAHHFALGVEASQALMHLLEEPEWIERYQGFAPHPFDDYTVSLWTGTDDGFVEVLINVTINPQHEHVINLSTLRQDAKVPMAYGMNAVPRDYRVGQPQHELAWRFCDAFRLLIATPGAVVHNRGPGNRHAIRKGRRVTFYSKTEITLKLDAVPRVRTNFANGFGKMMPVYQYRAHVCHSGGRRGCEHTWTKDETRANPYWTCDLCGRKRWHRKAGIRGSAEVGYVRQTYKVVKGNDK